MIGRRRPDARQGHLPDDIRAGDYWKLLDFETGEPLRSSAPSNLTGGVWVVVAPLDDGGYAIGNLRKHTVREHDDGTISVRPGDGSSNSILITRRNGQSFHGYIEHGIWSSC